LAGWFIINRWKPTVWGSALEYQFQAPWLETLWAVFALAANSASLFAGTAGDRIFRSKLKRLLTSAEQKVFGQLFSCRQYGCEFNCDADADSGQCCCHDLPNGMLLTEEARTYENCYRQKMCLEKVVFLPPKTA
jgi:hypothetical protein